MTLERDETNARRMLQALLNRAGESVTREELIEVVGPVWDTTELQRDFTVVGFLAPFVRVVRKSDGARGTLLFIHYPRFYFDFTKD